jgi:phosphate starvation-inducible PhoH-like protein
LIDSRKIKVNLHKDALLSLYGVADENLRFMEHALGVELIGRNDSLIMNGRKKDIGRAAQVIEKLSKAAEKGRAISRILVEEAIEQVREAEGEGIRPEPKIERAGGLLVSSKRDLVRARTKNQENYIDAIFNNQIVFGIGPAGTGKTYLATAAGLYFLREKLVERIILVRPVVEAGESLGFLPGDLKEKIDPYLRPLFDAIYDMIDPRIFHELVETEVIEVAPLAYMRGRTLNKAFVILDEAQNTTIDQMKMFLTRTGNDTKLVITGDITQIDLPVGKKSGLIHAKEIFEGTDDNTGEIKFCYFTSEDVSRGEIVKKILDAYEKYEKKK